MNIHVILKYLQLVINFSIGTFVIPLVHNKWHITQVIFIKTISIEGLLVFLRSWLFTSFNRDAEKPESTKKRPCPCLNDRKHKGCSQKSV